MDSGLQGLPIPVTPARQGPGALEARTMPCKSSRVLRIQKYPPPIDSGGKGEQKQSLQKERERKEVSLNDQTEECSGDRRAWKHQPAAALRKSSDRELKSSWEKANDSAPGKQCHRVSGCWHQVGKKKNKRHLLSSLSQAQQLFRPFPLSFGSLISFVVSCQVGERKTKGRRPSTAGAVRCLLCHLRVFRFLRPCWCLNTVQRLPAVASCFLNDRIGAMRVQGCYWTQWEEEDVGQY